MGANKVLLVVAVLGSLLGCISATELDGAPLSDQFWMDAVKIFAPWNSFMSFKETEQTLERVVAGMEAIDEDDREATHGVELANLKRMLSFNKFSAEKCGRVEDEIQHEINRVWNYEKNFGRANLLPYLQVCKQRQWSWCLTFNGTDGNFGKPEDIRTRATQFPGHLDSLVTSDGGCKADECDADWLARKLNVGPFDEETSQQAEHLLSSATFQQALGVVYADDGYYMFEEYFAPAVRQALAELSQAEDHYGVLGEPLQKLKYELVALLNVCTPEPSKCPSVFGEFSKVFAKDRFLDLRDNVVMMEYEMVCLDDMKHYCSFFE